MKIGWRIKWYWSWILKCVLQSKFFIYLKVFYSSQYSFFLKCRILIFFLIESPTKTKSGGWTFIQNEINFIIYFYWKKYQMLSNQICFDFSLLIERFSSSFCLFAFNSSRIPGTHQNQINFRPSKFSCQKSKMEIYFVRLKSKFFWFNWDFRLQKNYLEWWNH
jgi:hypothetical protein